MGEASERKWTKGPWNVGGYDSDDEYIEVNAGASTVAEVLGPTTIDATTIADAYLIAAAPDLYELVVLFEKSIEYEIRRDTDDEGRKLKTATLNLVRAALSRARGETTLPEPTPRSGVRRWNFTDRYQALGIPYPDLETMCRGHCEGTGGCADPS